MIHNIYNKAAEQDDMCMDYFNDITELITKEVLTENVIKCINALDKTELDKLNNGKKLFSLLMDVFCAVALKKCNNTLEQLGLSEILFDIIIALSTEINAIYDYKPTYYNNVSDESIDSSSSNDESSNDESNNDESNDKNKKPSSSSSSSSSSEEIKNHKRKLPEKNKKSKKRKYNYIVK